MRDMQSTYTYLSSPVTSPMEALNPLRGSHQIDERAVERKQFNPQSDLQVSTFFNALQPISVNFMSDSPQCLVC